MRFWRSRGVEAAAPQEPQPRSTEALDALVAGLFDYAGTFPPASLGLEAALAESARSPRLRRPGLVGADLVVSVQDLAGLDEASLRTSGFGDTEAKVAVVGVEDRRLDDAVVDVAEKNDAWAGVLRVVSLEAHGLNFPAPALTTAAKALGGVQLYVEPRMADAAWAQNVAGVMKLLRSLKADGVRVGLKVRGSGPTAVGPQTLGWLTPHVVALGNPFKATAGLHHPLLEPQYGNPVGFVGLAAALRLRQGAGEAFTAAEAVQCVTETDPGAFGFDGGLSWRGHSVPLPRLLQARRELPFAIGSCSLREPDADLVRLFGPPA